MKQFSKKLFSLVVLLGTTNGMLQAACSDDNGNRVVPFLQWRSQGRDMARKLYGTTSYAVYQGDMDATYGTFNVTLQYDQSFRNNRIADCLFGASLINDAADTAANNCSNSCGNKTLIISGLESADVDTPADWVAENFYLPRDFRSAITFSPKVQDVVVDFNLFVGLDRWVKGLYFRLYGPVVWNKASLNPCERVIEEGTAGYEAGFFAPAAVAADGLFHEALNFFGGCVPAAVDTLTLQPLRFAKFSGCNLGSADNNCSNSCSSSNHKTGFAELRGEFGYNYIQEKYRLLLNIQAAAPTGSRPNAEYLFPAQIGNGKHWELGVGLGGAWKMWGSEDGDKSFNFIVEADITHLFNAKQTRTFDLKGKPNSRYMLAERMQPTADLPAGQQLVNGTFQFASEYAPVANLTTKNVKVSIGAQGDVVAMFNYTCRGFSWDLGYNFWGMSASDISVDCNNNSCPDSCPTVVPFLENTWALKGDASVFGYFTAAGALPATNNPTPLGATENDATIFTGLNADETNPLTNSGVDNAQPAVIVGGQALYVANSTPAPGVVINTSVPPVFISAADFDIAGAEQRGLSHKIFTHFSYTWTNRDKWVPYVGAGFSAEFGSSSGHNDCNTSPTLTSTTDCPSSLSCALSKWAVEIKGGVSFH